MIRIDGLIQCRVVGHNVGADNGESQVVQLSLTSAPATTKNKSQNTHEFSKVIVSSVKLVIPKDHRVESELVDCLSDLLPAVVLEVKGTLRIDPLSHVA